MGKGAQQRTETDASSVPASSVADAAAKKKKPSPPPPPTRDAAPAHDASSSGAGAVDGDDGDERWDLALVDGRTGGGLPALDDGSAEARAAIAERRLLETQHVLVRERFAREVSESILAETTRALSAVRASAIEGVGGVGRAIGAGPSLAGETRDGLRREVAAMDAEAAATRDAHRRDLESRDARLRELRDEVTRLESIVSAHVNDGQIVFLRPTLTTMTSEEQEALVLSSRALIERARELEASVSGAFHLTPVPIRPRRRGERRSLRTFAGVSLRPPLDFNTRPRRLSTPLLTPLNSTPISSLVWNDPQSCGASTTRDPWRSTTSCARWRTAARSSGATSSG
jgi:hypothetical protein